MTWVAVPMHSENEKTWTLPGGASGYCHKDATKPMTGLRGWLARKVLGV